MSASPIDGWEPETSPTDSLLRGYAENCAAEMAAYAASKDGRVVRTDRYVLADHGAPAAIFNSVVLVRPAIDDLEEVAAAVGDEFRGDGGGRIYLWSPTPTVDLVPAGWHLEGHPTFAIRPPGGPLPPESAIRVERVADPALLTEWEKVVVNGFPFPDLLPFRKGCIVGERILDDEDARLWVAFDGDRPAAAAALHVQGGIAGFAMGATLPQFRRKGLWYALVRARLLEEPDLVAASVFSDDSRPGAEAIGFLPVSRWTLWSRDREATTSPSSA